MRPFAIGILCSAAFLATAGCNKTSRSEAPEAVNAGGEEAGGPYYTVKADDLSHADANITALQGRFEMVAATATDGIPSGGFGGACLVFPAKDLGFTAMAKVKCTTNASCSKLPASSTEDPVKYAPDPADPTHFENRYGYCDTQNNQCWSKPLALPAGPSAPPPTEPPVCNRPIKMTAGTVNAVPKKPPPTPGPGATPVDVSEWVKIGAKTRVVACLNGGSPPWPGGKPPCAELVSANRIEVMGNSATLHK